MNQPLEGIRVIDLGISTAGPYAARFLGDLGAEVIKVEPLDGENSRKLGLRYGDAGYLFHVNNYNKKSITLHVQHPRGRALFLDLVEKSDVVIENFSCGTMDKWGIGYTACRQRNPSIIYASAKGFGETGELKSRRAFDTVVQAMSGIMELTGEPDDPPVKAGPSVCDLMTASLCAMAVTAAIAAREPAKSQLLDCAMFDMGIWSLLSLWPTANEDDGAAPQRSGNADPRHVPSGAYPTRDGKVFVNVTTDAEWRALALLLELPADWDEDKRILARLDIDARMADWTHDLESLDAAERLQRSRIPAGPIWNLEQLSSSALLAERGMVRDHAHPRYGIVPLLQSPIARSGGAAPGVWRDQPMLGQHTEEIVGGLLGHGDELPALRDAKVIGA